MAIFRSQSQERCFRFLSGFLAWLASVLVCFFLQYDCLISLLIVTGTGVCVGCRSSLLSNRSTCKQAHKSSSVDLLCESLVLFFSFTLAISRLQGLSQANVNSEFRVQSQLLRSGGHC